MSQLIHCSRSLGDVITVIFAMGTLGPALALSPSEEVSLMSLRLGSILRALWSSLCAIPSLMLSSAGVAPLLPGFHKLLSVTVTTFAVFPSWMYLLGGDDNCMLSVPSQCVWPPHLLLAEWRNLPGDSCCSFYVVQLRTVVFRQNADDLPSVQFWCLDSVLPAPWFPSSRPDTASFRSCLSLPPGFLDTREAGTCAGSRALSSFLVCFLIWSCACWFMQGQSGNFRRISLTRISTCLVQISLPCGVKWALRRFWPSTWLTFTELRQISVTLLKEISLLLLLSHMESTNIFLINHQSRRGSASTTGTLGPDVEKKMLSKSKLREVAYHYPAGSIWVCGTRYSSWTVSRDPLCGCAILFNKDTFYPDISVKSFHLHDTRRGLQDQSLKENKDGFYKEFCHVPQFVVLQSVVKKSSPFYHCTSIMSLPRKEVLPRKSSRPFVLLWFLKTLI